MHGQISCTAIGTCRIVDPLSVAARSRPLKRIEENVYGFVHTSKEVLQQIDYIEGRDLPHELAPFMCAEGAFAARAPAAPDCYVVEISSRKELRFREHFLQINYFERVFSDAPDLCSTFMSLKDERDVERRRAAFDATPSFLMREPLEQSVLLEGYVRQTMRDELEADLALIVERLPGPVVFVTHINVTGDGGVPIDSRACLCGWMREICEAKGYEHFDPTPHVLEYGRLHALAGKGEDTKHYSSEFKPVLGGVLFDRMLAPLVSRAAHTRRHATHAPERTHAQIQAAVAEAKRRVAEGDLEEAEAILHGVLADDAGCAPARTLLGSIAFHRGDTTAATAEFHEAIQLDADAIEPRLMLVKSALRMGRAEEACTIADDLLRRAPDDLRILHAAAKAAMRAKRHGEAASTWQRIADLRTDQAAPYVELARCEMKLRDYDAALAAAQKALVRDPQEPAALVIKGDALLRLKRMHELAENALELARIHPRAAMAAVPALISSMHPEEAAKIMATAHAAEDVEIDGVMRAALIQTLERRGRLAAERGDAPAAALAWKAIRLIDAENERARKGLRGLFKPIVEQAREAAAGGDDGEAARVLASALEIDPDNARVLRELGSALERAGDWGGASECWERLGTIAEDGAAATRRAARAAMRAERYASAARLYAKLRDGGALEDSRPLASAMRRLVRTMRDDFAAGHLELSSAKAGVVLELDPGNEAARRVTRKVLSAYVRRLRVAILAGDTVQQEQISRQVLAIDPRERAALKALEKLYRAKRRHHDGLPVLERLIEVDPTETRHWIRLARCCRATRQYERGILAALKALEMEPGNVDVVGLLKDMLNRQAVAA